MRHSKTPKPPHKNRVENLGERRSILTVSEFIPDVWIWQASVSFAGMPIGQWIDAYIQKADKLLRDMVEGMGDEFVFMVAPQHAELDYPDLEGWDVINDPDAKALIHKSLGTNLPCPPSQFSAMHLWKSLTKEEEAQLL